MFFEIQDIYTLNRDFPQKLSNIVTRIRVNRENDVRLNRDKNTNCRYCDVFRCDVIESSCNSEVR